MPADQPPVPPPPPPPPPGRAGGPTEGDRGHEPRLKRTIIRPALHTPDPIDASYVTDRLTGLTHELANLLDGSMRCLLKARRSLGASIAYPHAGLTLCPAGERSERESEQVTRLSLSELAGQLDTVHHAMQQMAELVRASGGALAGFGDPRLGCGAAGALAEAVRHAVDVMAPVASDERIRLDAEISPDLGALRAGNVYTVITNGVRNAIESIQRAGTPDGRIDVIARVELGRTGRCVLIEIIDNGQGPPPPAPPRKSVGAPERSADPYAHVFGLGYTTKPDGTGIGLSVARDLVDELGGTIELCAREAHGGVTPRGAVLRVRFPCPTAMPGEAATGSARRVHGTDDRHSA